MTISAVLPAPDTVYGDLTDFAIAEALAVIEERRQRQELYERLYGPTEYDPRTHALTILPYQVRAIMTPAALGESMLETLGGRRLPIYTVAGRGNPLRWVFLTQPPTADDDLVQLAREILMVPATALGPGGELALPTPGDDRRVWKFGVPDRSTEPPAYAEAVRAATGGRRA
ncbi:hypothetical protein [Nocardia wallacei]|uniref:hypothetical protein n=1 Tax=Nocardia wallacei TaxID=480035 RepID=UPI002453C120|nr:hypothetical protein [Nocardia wallacei]